MFNCLHLSIVNRRINGIHILTLSTIFVIILFYGFSFKYDTETYLSIKVGRIIPPNCWIWTLLTFSFCNTHIQYILSDISTVYLIDTVMLPSWNGLEITKFSLIVQLTSALMVFCFIFIGYAITFNLNLLWSIPINGLFPILGGCLVATRQLTPDNVLANLPLGKFRMKHISFTIVVLLIFLALFGVTDSVHVLMLIFGVLVSWIYLRFYQRHSNGNVGDTTDAFKFSGFFPNHLEPPVSIASNAIYNSLVRMGLCHKRIPILTEFLQTALEIRVLESDPLQRHRQLALKMLQENLSNPTIPPVSTEVTDSPSGKAPQTLPSRPVPTPPSGPVDFKIIDL